LPQPGAILAPCAAAGSSLAQTIAALRAEGAVVVELLPGESGSEGPACDRRLVEQDGQWLLANIDRDGSG